MPNRILRAAARATRRLLVATRLDSVIGKLGTGGALAALRPGITHYRSPNLRTVRRGGVRLRLDLSDYMQWSAYYSVERALRDRLYALAGRGDVVIDVGSNIGEVLLGLANRVGPKGRAIGFEANPETLLRCRANIALNPALPAEVHSVGLGDKEGTLSLHRPSQTNSGADRFLAGAGGVQVRVNTLDRFVADHAMGAIDLIKIDVEGFELKVLAGAEATIRRFRPTLFIELCDTNLLDQRSSAAALVAWLIDKRYTVENAADGACLTTASDLGGCFMDVIARPA